MFAFKAGIPDSLVLAVDQHVKRQVASDYYDSQRPKTVLVGRLIHYTGV